MDLQPFDAPSIESLAALLPGYDIEAFVAKGGMGAVYKAHQRSLDRDVALKILPPELGQDEAFRASFQTEARAMARVNHPNLIGVYDFGEIDDLLYIVMEFVPGKSLFHSSHGQIIDPDQAVEIILGICRGLEQAHKNGVIHRDIKPANILLTPECEPKIGDFGIARRVGNESEGLAMATPGYTAPEIIQNPDSPDQRSDIFSVGVILYELLTGSSPSPDCDPPSVLVGCDPQLDLFWRTATQTDPTQRFASAKEMADELKAWLDRPRVGRLVTKVAQASKTPIGMPPVNVPTHRPMARNLAIIGLLLGVIVFALMRSQNADETSEQAKQQEPDDPQSETQVNRPPTGTTDVSPPSSNSVTSPRDADPSLQSLLRLKEDLVAGRREEMPIGTISRSSADYFLIKEAKTWEEAQRFAKSYGAQLPVIAARSELEWIASQVPAVSPGGKDRPHFWLGASRGGGSRWDQVDGSPWSIDGSPSGVGNYASVASDGKLGAATAETRHQFLIQWPSVDEDPADLEEMLAKTKASLETSNPKFPPGTVTVNGRHFLIVEREITAEEGRRLAALGGAVLMVPATEAEADWLESATASMNSEALLWLGGVKEELEWKWSTGESWTFGRWADGSPSGKFDTLAITPRSGWRDADPTKSATGLVLEWSSDKPLTGDKVDAESLDQLRSKAETMVLALDKKRQGDLEANARAFAWDLDVWIRSNSKKDIIRWQPGVDKMKDAVVGRRVPISLPKSPNATFPEPVLKIGQERIAKQEGIDAGFMAKAGKVREAFSAHLVPEVEAKRKLGQPELAEALEKAIADLADTKTWLASISSIGSQENPTLAGVKILSAIYGTGGKNADVTARVQRYVEEEMRSFSANPRHLGADPNPGWNKQLTITFEILGVKKRKSWGENSKVKMSAFTID